MPRSRILPLLRRSFSPHASGFNGIYNGGNLSHIQLRRGSATTSVSQEYTVTRGRKVPKNVRRAMIESYVAKYMASNSGKFPCAKLIQKEVGGSYYVVKELLQELQFSLKTSSTSNRLEEVPPLTTVDASSRKAKAVSKILAEAAHETVTDGSDVVLSAKDSVMENMDKVEPIDSKFLESDTRGLEKTEIEVEPVDSKFLKSDTGGHEKTEIEVEPVDSKFLKSDTGGHEKTEIEVEPVGSKFLKPDTGGHEKMEIEVEPVDSIFLKSDTGGQEKSEVEVEPVDSKFLKSDTKGHEKTDIKEELNTSTPLQASANEHLNEEVDEKSSAVSCSSNMSTETDGKIRHSAMLFDNVNKLNEAEVKGNASPTACSPEQDSNERDNDDEVLDATEREKEVRAEAVQESESLETKEPDDVLKRDTNVRNVPPEKPEEEGGIWKSLKSFADGIISFWRKS